MKIWTSIKVSLLITILFFCTQIFAQEPDWQQQNADLAAEKADTAKKNAETESINADTAAQNANTAEQNANTSARNANTAEQNANTLSKIVTPVPAPKEVKPAPTGFVNCFVVQAGWVNNVWVPEHRVCKYSPSQEGVAWVEGYWACTTYKTIEHRKDECTNWDWKPGHWVKTFEVY